MAPAIDPRTPVLVGVGTAIDGDVEAVELMVRAAEAAAADCGRRALLTAADRIVVPRGTWSYTDPARIVADRTGAAAATWLVDIGIPQQTPIDEALAAIAAGALDVVLVVGAEAKARAARIAKRASTADAAGIAAVMRRAAPGEGEATELDQGGAAPDVHQVPDAREIVAEAEVAAGLWAPVEQYALIESALRAADGLDVATHRRAVAALWARFNAVAQANPEAAFPQAMDADALAALGPGNRPLAFPYGKWHASQWTVDQGAALLLCSAEAAARHGVPRDRWIFPLVGIDSSAATPLTMRRDLHRWPAMAVLGRAAAARIGRPLADVEHAELYSCFPSAVRVQQRELGLPLEGTPTITGGMAFAGGPFNSFVLQATAAMVRRLRDAPGLGLVTTVSGLLTKPGLAVWSSAPDGRPPLVGDRRDEAAAATDTVGVLLGYDGPARVAAVTVTYEGMAPKELLAILDTPEGSRVIARTDDAALVDAATTDELIGRTFTVRGNRLAG